MIAYCNETIRSSKLTGSYVPVPVATCRLLPVLRVLIAQVDRVVTSAANFNLLDYVDLRLQLYCMRCCVNRKGRVTCRGPVDVTHMPRRV
jgi:hypothetical protein